MPRPPVALAYAVVWLLLATPAVAGEEPAATAESTTKPAGESPEDDKKALEVDIGGYLQVWWAVIEEAENGRVQPITGDEAVDVASGFLIRRARLYADFVAEHWKGRLMLALERSPRLLDFYAVWLAKPPVVEVWVGQMKIPATYEDATCSDELDFATRSAFSARIADWSLSRSPSDASPFKGIRTDLRDLGLAVKGEVAGFRYHAMIGNGLGANLFIGGDEYKGYLYANDFGAYFYGARLEYAFGRLLNAPDTLTWARVGGHACTNRHEDVVLNDERTVLDLDRYSWSVDLRFRLWDRVSITGMYGAGEVDDDFDADGKTDYLYSGWEVKAMVTILPEKLVAGVRYDVYSEEFFANDAVNRLDTLTLGVTWFPHRQVRLDLNFKWKTLDSPTEPDLDDNVLLLAFQFSF